jgi:hypothetical protein
MSNQVAIDSIKEVGDKLSRIMIPAGNSMDVVQIYQALQKALQALEPSTNGTAPEAKDADAK